MNRDAEQYTELGYSPIPLKAGSKKTNVDDWPRLSVAELWRDAPPDSNIGLRAGDGIAFIDADDKNAAGTAANVAAYLAGLGLYEDDYPAVVTASGIGRHYYVSFPGGLDGNSRKLSPDFGAGEFRYGRGAYVVAPPSSVSGGAYRLIGGDLRQLPRLTLDDVLPLLRAEAATITATIPTPTATTAPRRIPWRARLILAGEAIGKYDSQSEREQACILTLVNAGYDYASIVSLFWQHSENLTHFGGKSKKDAAFWLDLSYQQAVNFSAAHPDSPARQTAAALREWAAARAWPGRTGMHDRAVYLAHVEIAERAGTLTYGASIRELAELAGVSLMTAYNATRRLIDAGLLEQTAAATPSYPARYQLLPPPVDATDNTHNYTLPKNSPVRECISLRFSHDIFRHAALGKSAGEVWEALQVKPLTVKELVEVTGRGVDTTRRVLRRMAGIVDSVTGEYLPMVEQDAGAWRALPVDLDAVARALGVAGMGERQKQKHRQERAARRRALERGRMAHNG